MQDIVTRQLDKPPQAEDAISIPKMMSLLVGLLLWISVLTVPARAQEQSSPPAVTVTTVETGIAAQAGQFAGQVRAINAEDILARVEGFLIERTFTEGQDVEAGDLLFTIEPDQFRADVVAAEAAVQSAKASLTERESNYVRVRDLRRQDAVSQTQLEDALAQRDSARAAVTSADSDLAVARLRLSYTEVRAAQAGRIGLAPITEGNLVGPTSGALARIVQLDPIRIEYAISDRAYLDARSANPDLAQEELNQRFIPSVNDKNVERTKTSWCSDTTEVGSTGERGTTAVAPMGPALASPTVRIMYIKLNGTIRPRRSDYSPSCETSYANTGSGVHGTFQRAEHLRPQALCSVGSGTSLLVTFEIACRCYVLP